MLILKEVRLKKNLTRKELSELSGLSARTIQDAETRGQCTLSTAAILAKALEVKIDDLWRYEE